MAKLKRKGMAESEPRRAAFRRIAGIFNWAFKGLKELQRSGVFIQPAKYRQAISEYCRDVNPARAFLLDNYVAGFEYEDLSSQEIYDSYVRWCGNNC